LVFVLKAPSSIPNPSLKRANEKSPGDSGRTNIAENAGIVSVRLIRSGLSTMPVKISYTTYPTTATASNYAAVSGIVTFNPGETNKTITVPIFDTGHAVPYKQFLLELISASGGCWLGNTLTCIVTIEGTNTTPYFVTEPQSQTAFPGGTVTFNATGEGSTPPISVA
jgi:hypothetical protein